MQKDVFWKAAVITGIVFVLGILAGVQLDSWRLGEIRGRLSEIDLRWQDARLQSAFYQILGGNVTPEFCASALESNLAFNDKVYQQGLAIERAEQVNRFSSELLLEKERYSLLQLQFWLNAIDLKKRCENVNYSTLVYFYSHYSQNLETQLKQRLQSAVNLELKEKCGRNLMLIPLPADLNISAIDLVKQNYNISQVPSVLVNEGVSLPAVQTVADLERFIKC